ncbi:MAG: FAD-binding oxidoreductase [Wenzhouxiangellaceae bacterium]
MPLSPPIPIVDDSETLTFYGRDWTRFWPPAPAGVVFPESVEQLAELVRWARDRRVALVPSGGRTGLSGGAVAAAGEVVVSLDRMRKVIDFDPVDASMTVQAGLTVGELQRRAEEQGLCYPVDWAAADSAQCGGSVATNAGGIRVLRYGMTREWVRGLKVVDGRGETMVLNRGLLKNNSGYDLRHLMIGSEGTLGLIAEITFGLAPAPPDRSVMLLALSGTDAVLPVYSGFRQSLPLSAFEFLDRGCVQAVAASGQREFPLDDEAPCHVLVEFDDPEQRNQEHALQIFETLLGEQLAIDGVISQSAAQAEGLWVWREAISESITPRTPYKSDLAVRISRIPSFLDALGELVARRFPDFEVLWFGHIGDGNLHMNVLRPESWSVDEFRSACDALAPEIFDLVTRFGGTLSAEHGIGLLKRDHLSRVHSPAEITAMRGIKQLLDPAGILNPGKLLPPA